MVRLQVIVALAALFLAGQITAFAAQLPGFSGRVVDRSGAVIVGAKITLSAQGLAREETSSDRNGDFVLSRGPNPGERLTVEAEGFQAFETDLSPDAIAAGVVIVTLSPAPVTEQVVISATRTESRLGDTAASIIVLDSQRLADTAAVTLDDTLRQVPGLTLFRRSGSRTSNPTAQGVSLRGTGASGASRALVLADGVPLNDPFGGWVYWNRVPRESISRVEVLRGGASNLYGSAALGGIINVITRDPGPAPSLSLSLSGGSQSTWDSTLFAGARKGSWTATIAAADFYTDGYVLVDPDERGPVDTPAASRNAALTVTVARSFQGDNRIFARASSYGESRRNGTPLQINRTHLRAFTAGVDWATPQTGAFGFRAYGGTQVFDQTFSAVNAVRTAETLTRLQRSPSQHFGGSIQWSRGIGTRQAVVAGFEARAVRGSSDEIGYTAGVPTALIGAGGKETDAGIFLQDVIRVTPRLFVTAGARFDRWRNYDALTATQPLTASGSNTLTRFDDRDESAFSPHISALFKLSENTSVNASATRAFRAPALNELYRSFRVGNVLTLANEDLRAERLTGGEAGLSSTLWGQRLFVRGNFYWADVNRPIANVTLSTTPSLTTRQRQNLGRTRSAGFEFDAEARVNRYWTISGGYLFAHATVVEFPANRALEGLWVPQVARQQITFQVRFSQASLLTLALQGRVNGNQYEDDQNLFQLEPFLTLDAYVTKRVTDRFEIFVAGENLTNQRYSIGRTPIRTISPPLFVRVGLRLNWGN